MRLVVEFEAFRVESEAALLRADRSRNGRPPWDAVLMVRVLVLQALSTLWPLADLRSWAPRRSDSIASS